jgi:hypothetical protein
MPPAICVYMAPNPGCRLIASKFNIPLDLKFLRTTLDSFYLCYQSFLNFSKMSTNGPSRVIVVLGATGSQGRGVVRAILNEPSLASFNIRGITRDVDSPSAKRVLEEFQTPESRLSLAAATVYDHKSLDSVFEGTYGIFAVATEFIAGQRCETEEDLKQELVAGRQINSCAASDLQQPAKHHQG